MKDKLKAENRKLHAQITQLNRKLKENKKAVSTLADYITLLEQKIQAREKIIQNIAHEKNFIQTQIAKKQKQIYQLQEEVTQLKSQYKQVLINVYKQRNRQNPLLFILSATDFSQMYHRYQYLKTYAEYRKKQVAEINHKEAQTQEKILSLKQEKAEKERLIAEQKAEKIKIDADKQEQKKTLADLEKNKAFIIKQIAQKEQRTRQVQAKIQAIIKEEIRLARIKAEREARKARERAKKSKTKKTPSPILTKEAKALAANFAANKGALPWPVDTGTITQRFGKQTYKGLKNVYVNNSGIDIQTAGGASARSVFKGRVSAIIAIPGGNKAVLIQHGNYFSVYSNLSKIYVSKGENVTTRQPLGEIYKDSITGKSTLNFQVWKNTVKQNPASWISN